jgi:hypothetical protein
MYSSIDAAIEVTLPFDAVANIALVSKLVAAWQLSDIACTESRNCQRLLRCIHVRGRVQHMHNSFKSALQQTFKH